MDKKKGSGKQPIPFYSMTHRILGILLVGVGLNNKGSLTGENDERPH